MIESDTNRERQDGKRPGESPDENHETLADTRHESETGPAKRREKESAARHPRQQETEMANEQVGNFTATDDGKVSGPAAYMQDPAGFAARMIVIYAGRDTVFNYATGHEGSDGMTAVLVSLQTDYAAWLGMQRLSQIGAR